MRALKTNEVKQVAGGINLEAPIPPKPEGITWWEWEDLKRRLQQQR